jgi:hypothetical protein
VDWASLTAVGVVGIPDPFERYVRIEFWCAAGRVEVQVVIAMSLNVV